ncbi:MAG TPA: DinB family protein [Bryobacteraceae bacterium]|nr:DinB family protein [Bryobacteraceae bacterium]
MKKHASELVPALVESFAVNERMNQLLLEHLDPRAWRRQLPGIRTRTIAAMFSHVHNIRRKWLRLSAPHLTLPAQLERSRLTQEQARAALAESGARCCDMLTEALAEPGGRIPEFRRDALAKPWAAGAAMVAYMISHEAHHRGQACLLAHQLGYPLPGPAAWGLWQWEKLWSTLPGPNASQ